MEFVTVRFVDDRQVFIDGTPSGRTNQRLQVQAGTHTINLGSPHNYDPAWRRPTIQNTSILKPLVVTFAKE